MRKKKISKGAAIASVCIVAFAALLALARLLPLAGEARRAGGTPDGEPAAAVQRAGEPFILTGEELPEPKDPARALIGEAENYHQSLDWVGDMRVTVSAPVLYASAGEAGFAEDEYSGDATYLLDRGLSVIVVEVVLENVGATCQEQVVGLEGAPCIFYGVGDVLPLVALGYTCKPTWFSYPPPDEGVYPSSAGSVMAFPERGESITIRIGYSVYSGTYEEPVDAAASVDDYQLRVFDRLWNVNAEEIPPFNDGPVVVDLGSAQTAPEDQDEI